MEKDIINELTPEVLRALCVDYSSAYICDLKKDTAHPLKIMEKSHSSVYIEQTGNMDIRFSGLLKYFYDHVLIKESVPDYLEIFDRNNLMKYLAEHEYLVVKHQTLPNASGKEYFEAKIVKLHSNEQHFQVILGYRSIDDIVVEERKNEQIARERKQAGIIAALSEAYSTIFYIDLITKGSDVIKSSRTVVKEQQHVTMQKDSMERQIIEFVAEPYRDEYSKFVDMRTIAERLKESGSLALTYQQTDGVWIRSVIVPQRYDAEMNITALLIANRDVTRERQWEESQKEILRKALQTTEIALAEEEVKNEIISALSTLYKEIAVVNLQEMTYELVSGPDNKYEKKGQVGSLERLRYMLLNKNVSDAFKTEIGEFIDFHTLSERLKGKTFITKELKAISGKWYACTFIVKKCDADGNVTHALMAVQDIDEQKKQELDYQEKLKEAITEADRANDAKSSFLRRMSHDIRTPINGIRGMVEIEDYYSDDVEKAKECRGKIWQATDHLLSLVNDVLDMSKLESGKFTLKQEPFSLKKILDEVNTVSEAQAADFNVQFIHKDTQGVEHDRVIGSPVYVKRIFLNFTSNAIKYNRENGRVFVSGHEISFDGKTAWYEFVCEDTGIGMSEEFLEQAFDPFTQEEKTAARTKYSGTGLGLSISKQLIELLGGTLELESKEGVGTKVIFRLPLEVDQREYRVKKEVDYENVSFEGVRALLAEDNELNAEIASFMLEKHGISVTWVQNGKMAVEAFEEDPEAYDLIFMDVMMPVMSGLEAAEMIRELDFGYEIPIFAMTANAFIDDVQRSLDAGMNAHLTKPLQEKEIVKAIRKYVEEKE